MLTPFGAYAGIIGVFLRHRSGTFDLSTAVFVWVAVLFGILSTTRRWAMHGFPRKVSQELPFLGLEAVCDMKHRVRAWGWLTPITQSAVDRLSSSSR